MERRIGNAFQTLNPRAGKHFKTVYCMYAFVNCLRLVNYEKDFFLQYYVALLILVTLHLGKPMHRSVQSGALHFTGEQKVGDFIFNVFLSKILGHRGIQHVNMPAAPCQQKMPHLMYSHLAYPLNLSYPCTSLRMSLIGVIVES